MKTIKDEIEENRKMCNNWYEEGRNDMKKDVLGLIDEIERGKGEGWFVEELKAKIEG